MTSAVASNDAVRASSRPKNSSTNRRATWVDSTRSVGAWKEPTLSARECRSATRRRARRERLVHVHEVERRDVSTSSIVRATSTGGAGNPPRRCSGSSSPTPSTRTPPSGSNSVSGFSRAARISLRDSRTSARDREGASTSTCVPAPRARSPAHRRTRSPRARPPTGGESPARWRTGPAPAAGYLGAKSRRDRRTARRRR